ncbi:MAG: TIGR03564 family F420-dependent LLM class oxidoreductase [Sporichthyaceae bacterium]
MRIGANLGGEAVGAPLPPTELVEQAVAAEAAGFSAAWAVHFARSSDSLTSLAVAGTRTSRIDLGVGIVPTYPRHPLALAQQAATAQVFCGGRLTLGVGASHKPVIEGLHGLTYASPAAHMDEYLQVLVPLLEGKEVEFDGEFFHVHGGFAVAGTSRVSVVVGALGPRMVEVAGRRADGVVTWLAGPRSLSEVVVPTLTKAAADYGRPYPRVVAGVPVAVCENADEGRAQAEQTFARYGGLENYRRLFEREGARSVADLCVVGTEMEVVAGLRRLADAGVTELWPVVFGVGEDPAASAARTTELLATLELQSALRGLR